VLKASAGHGQADGSGRAQGLNFREVPRNIIVKMQIEVAVENKSVKALRMNLVETHWQELERRDCGRRENETG